MRRWLLVLMVLLLPLRGLVGDAMAGEMLQMHLQTVAQAAKAAPAAAGVHHECAGHEAQSQTEAPAGADCPTCAHCQACNSVAMTLPAATATGAEAIAHPLVPKRAQLHASAERARAFKPPIS